VVERGEKQRVTPSNREILEIEASEFPFLPFLIFLFPFFLTEKNKLLGRTRASVQAGQAQDPLLTITLFIYYYKV
jgi:F0F1-type ATP synthase assembly protein I